MLSFVTTFHVLSCICYASLAFRDSSYYLSRWSDEGEKGGEKAGPSSNNLNPQEKVQTPTGDHAARINFVAPNSNFADSVSRTSVSRTSVSNNSVISSGGASNDAVIGSSYSKRLSKDLNDASMGSFSNLQMQPPPIDNQNRRSDLSVDYQEQRSIGDPLYHDIDDRDPRCEF